MKKITFLIIILTATTVNTFSQTLKTPKGFEFGILLGFNQSNFAFDESRLMEQGPLQGVTNIDSRLKPGFNIGVLAHKIISNNLTFGFQPTLSFTETTFLIETETTPDLNVKAEEVFVEVPLHFALHLNKTAKVNPSFISGIKYGYDLANNSRTRSSGILISRSHVLSFDVGTGVEFKFKQFIMKPELIYSRSFGEVLDTAQIETVGLLNTVDKVRRQNLTLRFLFYNL